jgi:hypothetical protein
MEWAAIAAMLIPYLMQAFGNNGGSVDPNAIDSERQRADSEQMRNALLNQIKGQNERFSSRNNLDRGIVSLMEQLMPTGIPGTARPWEMNMPGWPEGTEPPPFGTTPPPPRTNGPEEPPPGGRRINLPTPTPRMNQTSAPTQMTSTGLDGGMQQLVASLGQQGQTNGGGFMLPNWLDQLPQYKKRIGY